MMWNMMVKFNPEITSDRDEYDMMMCDILGQPHIKWDNDDILNTINKYIL